MLVRTYGSGLVRTEYCTGCGPSLKGWSLNGRVDKHTTFKVWVLDTDVGRNIVQLLREWKEISGY